MPLVTIAQAIEACLMAKQAAGRRPVYVADLRCYLCRFAAGRESAPVAAFGLGELEAWFSGRNEAPATRAGNVGKLSALFGYAQRRGWIADNPCRRLERVTVELTPPRILSPAEARRLLHAARVHAPALLPAVALGLFAGVRPDELNRLEWAKVDLARGRVEVGAAASKVHRRRLVTLEPAAVAWLRVVPAPAGLVGAGMTSPARIRLYQAAGVGPSTDVLRHTAGSYLLALHGDAGRVAYGLGNSPRVLLRHYAQLVTPEDCAAFWALRP